MRTYFIAGNHRIGDSLAHSRFLRHRPKEGDENWVICNTYNASVYKFFMTRTALFIKGLKVLPDTAPLTSMPDYEAWVKRLSPSLYEDGHPVRLPPDDGFAPPLPLFPRIKVAEEASTPYLTLQVDSIASWKRVSSLFQAKFPLHSQCLASRNQRTAGDTVIYDPPFSDLVNILLDNVLHVGICSSVTRLAAMLNRPTIMCHWSKITQYQGARRSNPHNIDLINPSITELTDAIQTLITNITNATWQEAAIPDPEQDTLLPQSLT